MKFLLGMAFGVLCAVAVMMFPEAREAVLAELNLQKQEFSEVARNKILKRIRSSFLDESVYTDIVADAEPKAETGPEVEQVLWADQSGLSEPMPWLEPAVVSVTPIPASEPIVPVTTPGNSDVIQGQNESFTAVFQAVWSPFRSERSAAGFASSLSTGLSREFRVVRLSAGRYEVGFNASSKQELSGVLDSVRDFTRSGASKLRLSL